MNIINQQKVYELVKKIPKGKVSTYGIIAKTLGLKTPRIVGKYLHENKDPKKIPCHRVIFSSGKLSNNYVFGGYGVQKEKLKNEGVVFKKNKVLKGFIDKGLSW